MGLEGKAIKRHRLRKKIAAAAKMAGGDHLAENSTYVSEPSRRATTRTLRPPIELDPTEEAPAVTPDNEEVSEREAADEELGISMEQAISRGSPGDLQDLQGISMELGISMEQADHPIGRLTSASSAEALEAGERDAREENEDAEASEASFLDAEEEMDEEPPRPAADGPLRI